MTKPHAESSSTAVTRVYILRPKPQSGPHERHRPAGAAGVRHGEFKAGELIPGTRYRVLGLLGVGGMGSVYEVEHIELGKRFVLKALLAELARREDLVARLRNEQRALGRLEHPSIVAVTDAGMTSFEVPYFVMERLDGETLGARLKRSGCLAADEALAIAAGVLDGLSAAHEIGVVHRDIKPQNIFLAASGATPRPKILDFGVAKVSDTNGAITARGVAVGTPRYMSPEQASGERVDGRSDIYSVGLVLFECLSGRGPFDDARDANELLLAHLSRPVPRLAARGVPRALSLDALLDVLLAKDPAARPEHASAAARLVRECRAQLATAAGANEGALSSATLRLDGGPGAPLPTTHADGIAARHGRLARDGTDDAQTLARLPRPSGPNDTLIDQREPTLGRGTGGFTTAANEVATLVEPAGGVSTRTEILPALNAPLGSDATTHTRVPLTPTDGSRTLDPVPLPKLEKPAGNRRAALVLVLAVAGVVVGVLGLGRAFRYGTPRGGEEAPVAPATTRSMVAAAPAVVATLPPVVAAAVPASAVVPAVAPAPAPSRVAPLRPEPVATVALTPSAPHAAMAPSRAAAPPHASAAEARHAAAAPHSSAKSAQNPQILAGLPGSGL